MGSTARDQIWSTIFQLQKKRAVFTVAEIHSAVPEVSVRTVRNTLNAMVELDILDSAGGTGSAPRRYSARDTDQYPHTRFVPTRPVGKWTFQNDTIRNWVEGHCEGRVLNACAGESRLDHDGEIVRNDSDPSIDADLHVDVAELRYYLDHDSFNTVVFDPPYSLYQSNLRYDGRNVGHARAAKESLDKLLKPGGCVIELGYSGSSMPARLGYQRVQRVWFNLTGRNRDVMGSVDQKLPSDADAD